MSNMKKFQDFDKVDKPIKEIYMPRLMNIASGVGNPQGSTGNALVNFIHNLCKMDMDDSEALIYRFEEGMRDLSETCPDFNEFLQYLASDYSGKGKVSKK